MALVRILIDGYSLLHSWPELAPADARYSAEARDELVHRLTLYQDAVGTPITVFFDGAGAPTGTPKIPSTREMEILYSPKGKTADDLIERVAARLSQFGEVLAVTDDFAERDTVLSMGGMAWSCFGFIQDLEATLGDLDRNIRSLNRREKSSFNRPRT